MTDSVGPSQSQLAILIDAENVPPKWLDGIFAELKRYGPVTARQAYGNFSGALDASWTEALVRHAITPVDSSAYGTRKNAADIALVIGAMDLLHSGRFDGFAIVSGDTDFMRLSLRIREHGLLAYVFGPRTSSDGLRQAATRFFYLENLRRHAEVDDPNVRTNPLKERRAALPLIKDAVLRLTGSLDSWVPVELIEEELYRSHTDFDPRTYGHRNLVDLFVAMKGVNVCRPADEPARMRIAAKKTRRKRAKVEDGSVPGTNEGAAESGGVPSAPGGTAGA